MANLNTDLISPIQAMEEAIILHKSREAVANIEMMQSNGRKIDNNITFSSSTELAKLFYESENACILSDSIGFGVSVQSKENVWSNAFKEYLRKVKNISSVGFETALNDFDHNHKVVLDSEINWVSNKLNANSINGFSYDSYVTNSQINIFSNDLDQTKATIYFTNTDVNSQIEIYLNDLLVQTLNTLTSDNNIILSNEITLGSVANKISIKLISGKCSLSGVKYYNDINNCIDIYATGGRRIRYIKEEVKQAYLNYDLMLFTLGYNDIVGGSDDAQKQEVYSILADIATHYIANNKVFIYLNTLWDTPDVDNWVFNKLNELFAGYAKYKVIDYKGSITDNNGDLFSSDARINILKQWGDSAHPNDLGHNRLLRYLLVNIFNEHRFLIEPNKGIEYKNYSIFNDKNIIPDTLYGCNIFGINNKAHNSAKFTSLIGIGNESTDDVTYSCGEYNKHNTGIAFSLGIRNTSNKTYTTMLGTYAKALNGGVVEGYSSSSSIVNQKTRQHRTYATANATETYLRGLDASALIATNINTRNILKGNVYCFDNTNDLVSVFKIDCIVTNTDGINTVKTLNGSIEGIITELNENNVSCRIVSSNNEYFTIRVTGNVNNLKWISDFEMIEFSK